MNNSEYNSNATFFTVWATQYVKLTKEHNQDTENNEALNIKEITENVPKNNATHIN